jgi:uncharacterized protein (TIGR02996 family)
MTRDDGFLQAIIDSPHDDGPRLIYADWLEERGERTFAEFIRVQCRLHALAPDAPGHADLREREEELRACLAHPWPEDLPRLPRVHWESACERGFPAWVSVTARDIATVNRPVAALCATLEEVVERTPVRGARLYDLTLEQTAELLRSSVLETFTSLTLQSATKPAEADEEARLLAASPAVRNLKRLYLYSGVGDAGLAALARSPHLGRLTWFGATPRGGTPAGLRALSKGRWFRGLHGLELWDAALDNACVTALAGLPPFPHLHTLALSDNRIGPPAARALAQSRTFPKLAHLDLSRTRVGPEGVAALAESADWPLAELELWLSGAGNAGAQALAHSPLATSLHTLNLGNCSVGPSGVEALAAAPRLGGLRRLTLAYNPIRPRGLLALARSPHLRSLTSLDLHGLPGVRMGMVVAEDVRRFLQALALPALRHLNLSGLPLHLRGARVLASSPHLGRLTRLALSETSIPDAGAAALLGSPALQGLLTLDLDFNRIRRGVAALADPDVLPRLVRCGLHGNAIPRRLANRIKKRFPSAL